MYDPKKIESKWKEIWKGGEYGKAVDFDKREKKYVLVEFPYPSGSGLHVGHSFFFTGGDVYARFLRLKGYNVLFPIGWDAFGLPTENYAIKMKKKPRDVTAENTAKFREQMDELGLSFDWSREVNTTDPQYYKWTQWIFIKLFEKGLAIKEERPINWCPSCKIGLANEEVVDGNCERCGTKTEKRNISQWIVKITDYADRLIDGLKDTQFIEKVKAAQINWIDRKEWIDITYDIEGRDESVTVSTTRPDTNFGATFIVLAPEHQLATKLVSGEIATAENIDPIKEYVSKSLSKSELDRQKEVTGREKTGVFTGLYAINNLNGKKLPIWIADFVLGTVGTGAVVGVPAHDIRDFEFAKQFSIEIARVVVGSDGDSSEVVSVDQVQEKEGTMINSGFLDGLDIHDATVKMMEYLEKKGWGKRTVRYHLRDWIFSRQHYWGEPIPMIDCEKCGWNPVNESELPIVLPDVEAYEPTDTGESPLAKMTDWVNTKCPKCGGEAKRETDTMPNWAGSDWYFLRYLDPTNEKAIADSEKMKYWMPVDYYLGGDEHNTLHLLYSRFIHQFLYDLGAVNTPEPYDMRISHGIILGQDGRKMSKSRGNVIVPEKMVEKVGADALRVYMMFIGPFDGTMAWNDRAMLGAKRFLDRVHKFVDGGKWGEDSDLVKKEINTTTENVSDSLIGFQYNTVVAAFMKLLNTFETEGSEKVSKESIEKYIVLLSPYAPFLTEELWQMLGNKTSVHEMRWPEVDKSALEQDFVEVPVQINGKVKNRVNIYNDIDEQKVRELVLSDAIISEYVKGREIIKFVYVPGRVVNVVVKG